MKEIKVKFNTITPIWSGDADRGNTVLRETGIIGSLRWWYEALIRGLGGNACDPTNSKCEGKNHCAACELFGCTGWARKFRLEVETQDDKKILKFTELRKIGDIEWALLNKTLQIIANYGALGGKLADSKYGLIKIEKNDSGKFHLNKRELKDYLKESGDNIKNPNLRRFIFINQNLKYQLVKDFKNNLPFIKGRKGKGKRYFYKTLDGKPYRLFVYAENDGEYNQIIEFLEKNSAQFVSGKEILEGD